MSTPLDNARKKLHELKLEIARIERFIREYAEFSDRTGVEQTAAYSPQTEGNLSTEVSHVDNPRLARERIGPTPTEIVGTMERMIREVGRPMTRGEIVEAFARRDIEIPAQDKSRYVGTLAWRHKSKFINVEGRGYWLRGEMIVGDKPQVMQDPPEEHSDELPL
jgi:hypothetical protein